MRMTPRLMATTALALLSGPAFALTAEEVWTNQTAYLAKVGVTVSQDQSRSGNVLTVEGIRYDVAFPFGTGSLSVTSGPQTYTENADGSVNIGYPALNDIGIVANLRIPGEGDITISAIAQVAIQGQNVVATGTPDHVTYAVSQDMLELTLTEITFLGESDLEELDVDMYLSIADTKTTVEIITAGTTIIQGETETGQTISDFGVSLGDEFASKTVSQQSGGQFGYTLTLPAEPIDLMNISQALRNGLALQMGLETRENLSQAVNIVYGEMLSNQSTTSEGSLTELTFDTTGFDMVGEFGPTAVTMQETAEMPFPIDAAIGGGDFRFMVPVNAAPEPALVRYYVALNDLTLGDPLWAIFDSAGIFPHDPIDALIDLESSVLVKTDLLDIAAMSQVIDAEQIPFDIQGVTINDVGLAALGAEVGGSGTFTLDMTDLDTFDGFPRPTGTATASMRGIYTLLDMLVDADLIAPDDAMQGRLVLGMFAEVTGEDVLESTLEINAEGHVIANGQRIQ